MLKHYAIVEFSDPVLHLVEERASDNFVYDAYHRTRVCQTQCGLTLTGMLDDAEKYVVTCLTCLCTARTAT